MNKNNIAECFTFFNNCVTVRADEKAEKMEKPESGASSELRRRGGMVDTIDSKSIAREGVRVQVSSPVLKPFCCGFSFFSSDYFQFKI